MVVLLASALDSLMSQAPLLQTVKLISLNVFPGPPSKALPAEEAAPRTPWLAGVFSMAQGRALPSQPTCVADHRSPHYRTLS